jgi:hypothetical protein
MLNCHLRQSGTSFTSSGYQCWACYADTSSSAERLSDFLRCCLHFGVYLVLSHCFPVSRCTFHCVPERFPRLRDDDGLSDIVRLFTRGLCTDGGLLKRIL